MNDPTRGAGTAAGTGAAAGPGRAAEAGSGPDRQAEDGSGPRDILDCRGQRCPLPVIALARRLPALPVGTVLRVLADDPAAANDIPAWCRMRGQDYLGTAETDGGTGFDVRRVS